MDGRAHAAWILALALACGASAGCVCGSFEAYVPGEDREYSGHEVCGADLGSFGEIDVLRPNQFTLFVSPRVHGSAARREEINHYTMVVYLRRDEMVAGGVPELNPFGELGGLAADAGEVEVLEAEEVQTSGTTQWIARYRLRWDLSWGVDDGESLYLHAAGTDWIEAFL